MFKVQLEKKRISEKVVSVIVCKKGGLEAGKATLPLVIKR